MQKGYYAASFCRILMARDFFTMDDFDLAGHTVLLRVDINSPVDPATGQLLNDARIREHLTTIRELRHSKVALLAHQSRPGKDDFTTLEAHAERIGVLLGRPVRYVSSLFGRPAIDAIDAMRKRRPSRMRSSRKWPRRISCSASPPMQNTSSWTRSPRPTGPSPASSDSATSSRPSPVGSWSAN